MRDRSTCRVDGPRRLARKPRCRASLPDGIGRHDDRRKGPRSSEPGLRAVRLRSSDRQLHHRVSAVLRWTALRRALVFHADGHLHVHDGNVLLAPNVLPRDDDDGRRELRALGRNAASRVLEVEHDRVRFRGAGQWHVPRRRGVCTEERRCGGRKDVHHEGERRAVPARAVHRTKHLLRGAHGHAVVRGVLVLRAERHLLCADDHPLQRRCMRERVDHHDY